MVAASSYAATPSAATTSAATTTRYLVATRKPLHIQPLRMVADPVEAAAHDVNAFEMLDAFAVSLTDAEAAELRQSPAVRYLTPVVPREIAGDVRPGTPASNASQYLHQNLGWGIDFIHARDVWPASRGANVNVAILDTGIDRNHPDLKDRYAGGYNVLNKTDDPVDDHRHGTHVAGIIGASDNSIGVVGVAPEVKIWSVKILDEHGQGTDEYVAAGLNWVLEKKKEVGGHWVLNFSIGSALKSPVEEEAVQRALADGVIIVAAAGNRSFASVDYPGGYRGVMAIGALQSDSRLAEYSSYGQGLWLTAPGSNILSTMPTGTVPAADVDVSAETISGYQVTGSAIGDIHGPLVFCGYGRPEDFPPNMTGKIALISRSPSAEKMLFRDKAKNAKNAGAAATIIFNIESQTANEYEWTLWPPTCDEKGCSILDEDKNFPHLVTVGVTVEGGKKLLAQTAASTTEATVSARMEAYQSMDGTSMATPHVVGSIALLWALAPNATPDQIRNTIIHTTKDLGAYGWDMQYGYGALDVLKAAQVLNPAAFGLSEPPKQDVPKHRGTRH